MRGLARGETSSTTNPVLQLFSRQGGFLVDIYSGSFVIEDIRAPGADPVEKVAATALTVADKVSTGCYAIPSGSTAAWNIGTHRVTVSYVLEDGGPTYKQIIDFEILDVIDWPASGAFVSYISSRNAYLDGYVVETTTPQQIHRHTSEVSHAIEQWTRRWFEPRFITLRTNGGPGRTILLDNPIIAVADVTSVWDEDGSYVHPHTYYKVFNRHLDGFFDVDDRKNPKIEITSTAGLITREARLAAAAWPSGVQNLEVSGVFGYTDADFDPTDGAVLIGHAPVDLSRACGVLMGRQISDPGLTNPMTWSPGSVRSYRTRYQSVTFGGGGSSSSGGGGGGGGGGGDALSGDPLIDAILVKYYRPIAFGAA